MSEYLCIKVMLYLYQKSPMHMLHWTFFATDFCVVMKFGDVLPRHNYGDIAGVTWILYRFVESSADNICLLFRCQLDKVNSIAGYTDG